MIYSLYYSVKVKITLSVSVAIEPPFFLTFFCFLSAQYHQNIFPSTVYKLSFIFRFPNRSSSLYAFEVYS